MAYCSSCGSEVFPEENFCGKCGKAVANMIPSNNSLMSQQDQLSITHKLTELADNLDSLQSIISQTESVKSQLQIPEPRKPIVASRWWAMKGFVFGGIGALGFGLWLILIGINAGYASDGLGFITAISVIAGIGLLAVGISTSKGRMELYNSNSQQRYNNEVQKRNEQIANLQKQYTELENSKTVIIERVQDCLFNNGNAIVIPENYFYSEAIRFFADRLATRRSNTLAEAMDAYDVYIHQLKLEQAANEAGEYQRQSAANLAAIQREQTAIRRQGAVNTALHVANTIRHW